MKLIAQPEQSFLSTFMWGISRSSTVAGTNKKLNSLIDDQPAAQQEENGIFLKSTGDPFFDLIGRFCSPSEALLLHEPPSNKSSQKEICF